MGRYFFDFHDGEMHRDAIGHECAGHAKVRLEAMHALPAIAKDKVPKDGNEQAYTILVRNERNLTVYTATLTFAGIWLGEDDPPTQEEAD